MKKGQIVTGIVEEVKFPNKGIVKVLDEETDRRLIVKNVITVSYTHLTLPTKA